MKCAVLISSCDSYQQFLPGLFYYMRKNLKLSWPVYFYSQRKLPTEPGITTFAVDLDSWSDRLIVALDRLEEYSHLMCIQENDWPAVYFTDEDGAQLMEAMDREQMDNLRLTQIGGHVTVVRSGGEVLGAPLWEVTPKSKYRFSYQPALWKRESLRKYMGSGESVWQAEHRGSKRVPESAKVFVLELGLFANLAIKGKWIDRARENKMRTELEQANAAN